MHLHNDGVARIGYRKGTPGTSGTDASGSPGMAGEWDMTIVPKAFSRGGLSCGAMRFLLMAPPTLLPFTPDREKLSIYTGATFNPAR